MEALRCLRGLGEEGSGSWPGRLASRQGGTRGGRAPVGRPGGRLRCEWGGRGGLAPLPALGEAAAGGPAARLHTATPLVPDWPLNPRPRASTSGSPPEFRAPSYSTYNIRGSVGQLIAG